MGKGLGENGEGFNAAFEGKEGMVQTQTVRQLN
jgi:hypothetical protein